MTNLNDLEYFNRLLYSDYNNQVITNNSNNNTINELCLISNKPLDENAITLTCNHKFNYEYIYNEVVYQKTKKILDNNILKINQIKCPYCRTISNFLLPNFKYYNLKKIIGVNHPNNFCLKMCSCEFNNTKTNTYCGQSACITNYGIFCNKHIKYTKNEEKILENVDKKLFDNYKKFNVNELKKILKNNKCKMSGKKNDLIERILLNKEIKNNWIE